MKSGEMTCIYSTPNYVHGLATTHHVPTVITFDQPLFWKASEIVQGLPMGHQLLGHNNYIWLNYQYMSEVARTQVQYNNYGWITNIMLTVAMSLVKAGRTGSWNMHLGAMSKCLPIVERYCRAFQLQKSAYLYLPDTTQLFSANSERCYMYDKLTDIGWDLGCVVTEQTIMWTLKSVGQLTCCSKRSQKAKTLALMLVVKVSGDQTIESALLYGLWLWCLSRGIFHPTKWWFYELCPFTPSLVEARYIMCKADKRQLADFINVASMLFHIKLQCYFGFGTWNWPVLFGTRVMHTI